MTDSQNHHAYESGGGEGRRERLKEPIQNISIVRETWKEQSATQQEANNVREEEGSLSAAIQTKGKQKESTRTSSFSVVLVVVVALNEWGL